MSTLKRVWIIGSGPSARLADFNAIPSDDIVFGVNGTVEWVPHLDWWFTLDKNPINLKRLQSPKLDGVRCIVALPDDIILPKKIIRYKRLTAMDQSNKTRTKQPRRRNTPLWWMWRWQAIRTLSEIPGVIHTGNSMWGALQIAYQHNFRKIILVGLDGSRSPRVEGGNPNSLLHLPILFESAVDQLKNAGVQVFNSNPNSKVTCFPRVTFSEAIAV